MECSAECGDTRGSGCTPAISTCWPTGSKMRSRLALSQTSVLNATVVNNRAQLDPADGVIRSIAALPNGYSRPPTDGIGILAAGSRFL